MPLTQPGTPHDQTESELAVQARALTARLREISPDELSGEERRELAELIKALARLGDVVSG